jgi:hypothetical protein
MPPAIFEAPSCAICRTSPGEKYQRPKTQPTKERFTLNRGTAESEKNHLIGCTGNDILFPIRFKGIAQTRLW